MPSVDIIGSWGAGGFWARRPRWHCNLGMHGPLESLLFWVPAKLCVSGGLGSGVVVLVGLGFSVHHLLVVAKLPSALISTLSKHPRTHQVEEAMADGDGAGFPGGSHR